MLTKPPEIGESLIEAAITLMRSTHRATASMFQRRLRLSYPHVGRLMDEMENRKIIGPPVMNGTRDILIDLAPPPVSVEDLLSQCMEVIDG
jgi:S-DNA-T family DNA segregation ATPase FtsK/SpoIIIE